MVVTTDEGLVGTVPPENLSAPTFAATNWDETARDREALMGQPTVMWFFPFSDTPG
jgi:peroxiredoxin